MLAEVSSAVAFLSNLMRARSENSDVVDQFRLTLEKILCNHYENHWHEGTPCKGSGFRCLRILPNRMDPLMLQAAYQCGISVRSLFDMLPSDITMWVDPAQVAYRIGEEGSIGVLFGEEVPVAVASSPTPSASHSSAMCTDESSASSDSSSDSCSPSPVPSKFHQVSCSGEVRNYPYNHNHNASPYGYCYHQREIILS
jgi:protein Tob/BTG